MIWRPVVANLCTLAELHEKWDINDLCDAHEALDLKEEAEKFYHDQPREHNQ